MRHHLILRVITKLLVGTIFLFALYVQFHGDYSPGGGFQAGVIMAVGFILYGIVFSVAKVQKVFPPWLVHKLVAFGVLLYGNRYFQYADGICLSGLHSHRPSTSFPWTTLGYFNCRTRRWHHSNRCDGCNILCICISHTSPQ